MHLEANFLVEEKKNLLESLRKCDILEILRCKTAVDFFDIPWIYQVRSVRKGSNKNLLRYNVESVLSKRCSFFAKEDIYVAPKID